ncbi:hypothetical protein FOYG_11251 [Fusarium oxysporum NRRL 32931]|uniref:Uncharacterized protein n=1 Tax=Fusarium oxysporum NRRL 32931 TaxID=660029 RepID=W9HX80_FUSOX|nr:hypothetical protein FOYG_11251 [Fusarium oxysporum NRRL 32931]
MASADAHSLAIRGVPLLYNARQHGFLRIEDKLTIVLRPTNRYQFARPKSVIIIMPMPMPQAPHKGTVPYPASCVPFLETRQTRPIRFPRLFELAVGLGSKKGWATSELIGSW